MYFIKKKNILPFSDFISMSEDFLFIYDFKRILYKVKEFNLIIMLDLGLQFSQC